MIDALRKKIATLFVKPLLSRYLKKDRETQVKGFRLLIKPTVFHPKFFFSSTYLFDFVNRLHLEGKFFLEIGCGCGLISLLAHKKKAVVCCVDINPIALECTKENFRRNFDSVEQVEILHSDVWSNVPVKVFDYIVINPPYFFSAVENQNQLAWNCGENGEYFTKLFSGLKIYSGRASKIYMILADNCDLDRIAGLAAQFKLKLELIEKKKIKWETNFIYSIVSRR